MFDGLSLEDLFLIVFGVVIFVIGTTSLRNQIRIKRAGNVLEGTVLRTKRVDKKDSDGNLIQNYFEIRVEYLENGHKSQCTIRSVSEYREGGRMFSFCGIGCREISFTIYDGGNTPGIRSVDGDSGRSSCGCNASGTAPVGDDGFLCCAGGASAAGGSVYDLEVYQ